MAGALDSSDLISAEADDGLIAEAAKTDPHAFGQLYERYYTRVYRYIFHRIARPSEAEDLTAVVFMKALEGLHSFQSDRSGFAPWLFRIARNSVVDHYRRTRPSIPIETIDHHAADGDPVSHALDGERADELGALIRSLSPEQQEVILLRFSADLSYAEISATIGKNEPAVRMLLHRGLRKLKTVMDDG